MPFDKAVNLHKNQ